MIWVCQLSVFVFRDNPDIDVYGANLFNRYLQKRIAKHAAKRHRQLAGGSSEAEPWHAQGGYLPEDDIALDTESENINMDYTGCRSCHPILVSTGVYSSNRDYAKHNTKQILDHTHRDFIMDPELRKPAFEVENVLEAIQLIFKEEGIIS